jgi:hypothetical protein
MNEVRGAALTRKTRVAQKLQSGKSSLAFCQVEAAEAVIWLTEVGPNPVGQTSVDHLAANNANPGPGGLR